VAKLASVEPPAKPCLAALGRTDEGACPYVSKEDPPLRVKLRAKS